MHLLLASLLACTALIVILLAPDWKPYSFSQSQTVASLSNDSGIDSIATYSAERPFLTNSASAGDPEFNQHRIGSTNFRRAAENVATTKTFPRMRDALIRLKDRNLMTESANLLESQAGHALTFTDPKGHTVKVRFHFNGSRSFDFLVDGKKIAKVEKVLKSIDVSGIVKREIRNGLADTDCAERTEARRELREELRSSERLERSERDQDVARP